MRDRRSVWPTAILLAAVAAGCGARIFAQARTVSEGAAPSGTDVSIRWASVTAAGGPHYVELKGLAPEATQLLRQTNWSNPQWQSLFAIYAEAGTATGLDLPAILGQYQANPTGLRFEPRFPFVEGMTYRAVLHRSALPGSSGIGAAPLSWTHQVAKPHREPSTVVAQIYPTARVLPENQLKFYVHFSAPMSRGHIYESIHLQDAAGREVEFPFLELNEELWNPEMTRLTLLLDPGRIKRGLRPLEEVGSALQAGKTYTLIISPRCQDARGNPLKAGFEKKFRAGPPDRDPPDPQQWKISPPKSGSLDPLAVDFVEPLDRAVILRGLRVGDSTGATVAGKVDLAAEEREWTFTPVQAWAPGTYHLLVPTAIEDLAGNNIDKPFDVDLLETIQRHLTNPTVKVSFDVR